jgi:hypothetical protein
MALLLSELQTALNDVVVACLEAADGHAAAAGMLAQDPAAELLAGLAEARRLAAARLGEIVRALGHLPPAPDADLEAARELATRVKTALAPDQRQTLLAERAAAEEHVQSCVAQALSQPDLPDAAAPLLQELRADSAEAGERLAGAAAG